MLKKTLLLSLLMNLLIFFNIACVNAENIVEAVITIQKGALLGTVPFSLNVDGSNSKGEKLKYHWVYPDKTTESKNPPSYRFTKAGNFQISLTVTDLNGKSDTKSIQIEAKEKVKTTKTSKSKSSPNGNLSNDILINEIFPNPKGTDTGKEWIELYNKSSRAVNLGNWSLTAGTTIKKLSSNLTVPVNGFLILNKETAKITLRNSATTLLLKDFQGKTIDELKYTETPEDQSYARIEIKNNDQSNFKFFWTTPTENSENPVFYQIEGQITKEPENGIFEIGTTTITIPAETDPNLVKLFLNEGNKISILAQNTEGTFLMKDYKLISKVTAPKAPAFNWLYLLIVAIPGLFMGLKHLK